MIERDDVFNLFSEWMDKTEAGIQAKDGNVLCEATRMVLAFVLIMHAYFPDTLTIELGKKIRESFVRALACVSKELKDGNDADGCYDLYEKNIQERLEKYDELSENW